MTTALLQCLIAALKLGFGGVALRVAAATRAEGVRSVAWLLAGIVFAAAGVIGVLQSAWALRAVLAGAGAPVYEAYLRWAPALNYGRHLVMLGLAVLLLGLPLLARVRRVVLASGTGVLLATCAVLGGWLGVVEGDGRWARHYMTTAALESVEMIVLAGALLAALALGTMDRVLWIALAVYTVRQAFNVLSFSALSWTGVEGAWSPSPQHIAWIGSFHWALLLALGVHRLRLASRGETSPPMLDPAAGRPHSSFS